MGKYKAHKMKAGAKFKGWIKNNDTGDKKSFQFNPSSLQYGRSATYSEISSPGMAYPNTQFIRGNYQTFSIELFMYDRPCTGKIRSFEKFLNKFLTSQTNSKKNKRPPSMTICMGYFIKKCVMESLDVSVDMFDDSGNPTQATFTLSLTQVGV